MLMTKEKKMGSETDGQMIVSSCSLGETASDSRLLFDLGKLYNSIRMTNMILYWDYYSALIVTGWESLGIDCVTGSVSGNEYYLHGRPVTRREAVGYALSEFKTNKKVDDYFD
ncbi:MAG: hypothetical protein K5869_08625 [Saccharofermentans sp.]|nr:hypothetical protein [Saccharofermentans sp.]